MASKKRKVDDSDDAPDIERSQTIWYTEGMLIVQAQHVQFRVFKELLAERCPTLKEHMERKRLRKSQKCDVLDLPDDPKDVEVFLSMIFRPNSAAHPDKMSLPFSVVAGAIRLGIKYRTPDVAIPNLRRLLTTFSAEWSAAYETCVWVGPGPKETRFFDQEIGQRTACLGTICLADELGLPDVILPSAYRAVIENMASFSADDLAKLPAGHLARILRAAEPVRASYLRECYTWLMEPSPGDCGSVVECDRIRTSILAAFAPGASLVDQKKWTWTWSFHCDQMCRCCRRRYSKAVTDGYDRWWDSLPAQFGLGSFDTLKKDGEKYVKNLEAGRA
ncbi:BTB domain-containing protein [Mycena kentingensis (nom. inval.)]|nr:BTB domain-containing protein [Mycena kentingensis (nom. inval.)]